MTNTTSAEQTRKAYEAGLRRQSTVAAPTRSIGRRCNWTEPLLLAVLVAVLWAALARAVGSTVFPSPLEALAELRDDLALERFRVSVLSTMQLLVVSYALAVLVGGIGGFFLGLTAFWGRVLRPLLYSAYSVPKVVFFPVFLAFFGLGEISRVAYAFLHGFFPIILIVMAATANIDRTYLRLAASIRLSPLRLIRHILVPGVLPALLTGMRLGFGLTFLGLILAEMFAANSGLGYELVRNISLVRLEGIMGQIVLVAVIALGPVGALTAIERKVHSRFRPPSSPVGTVEPVT